MQNRLIGKNRGWLLLLLFLLVPAACTRPPEIPPQEPVAKPPPSVVKGKKPRSYVVFGKTYYPMSDEEAVGYVEEGIASWYGKEFHNRPTAIGERYDMHGISAAHTTLPLPMWARVTNLNNGQSMEIRINDRGPFFDDRLIDLSYAAAVKLGYAQQGSARVRVEALRPGTDVQLPKADPMEARRTQATASKKATWQAAVELPPKPAKEPASTTYAASAQKPEHYIQIGSFGLFENAKQLANRLQGVGKAKVIKSSIGARIMYRVRFGPYSTLDKTQAMVRALQKLKVDQAQIILE